MWFQEAECHAVNARLLLNLINNNFLTFLTKNLPILNPYLLQKSKNLRSHSSNSVENVTPSSGTSPWASCNGAPPPPPGKFLPVAGHWPKLPAEISASTTQPFFLLIKFTSYHYTDEPPCANTMSLPNSFQKWLQFSQSKPKLEPLIPIEHNFSLLILKIMHAANAFVSKITTEIYKHQRHKCRDSLKAGV